MNLDPIANSPGYFKVRLVRGGALVPARMWIDEHFDEGLHRIADDTYLAEVGDKRIDAFNPPGWPESWQEISKAEWEFMRAEAAWAREHEPDGPIANPTRPAHASARALF